MSEGIKETKEMLEGMLSLAMLMGSLFKDGMQPRDFLTLIMELQSNPKFIAAFENLHEIPAEAKDIDLDEAYELVGVMIPFIKKILAKA